MEVKEIEGYSETSNFGIVRMPGRSFPGCVIQGDTLSIHMVRIAEIHKMAMAIQNQELIEFATDLLATVSERLLHYETVLTQHGIRLPYTKH